MNKQYVISENQIQEILRCLGECPHKHVNIPSAILVSLPELISEENDNYLPESEPELLEE